MVNAAASAAILVTGGAGFIGSHTCVNLLEAGHELLVVDNFFNSSVEAIRRVEHLTGRSLPFEQVDLRNEEALSSIIGDHGISAVIHFAGMKAVGESVEIPLEYYDNNVHGTLCLLRAMRRHNIRDLVFSSSCSIYGQTDRIPLDESAPPQPTNPYARSKWVIEQIFDDVCRSEPDWSIISLRYFNPTGAHASGEIGEDPRGIPNNLMPFVMQVATGRRKELSVFGDDYVTHDGTGVRDYIHVVDLAEGHRQAVERLPATEGHRIYNLGTGVGSSVLEVVAAAQMATGHEIPHRIVDRRAGDVAVLVADASLAKQELSWEATRDLAAMCADAWNFQQRNPQGYAVDTDVHG